MSELPRLSLKQYNSLTYARLIHLCFLHYNQAEVPYIYQNIFQVLLTVCADHSPHVSPVLKNAGSKIPTGVIRHKITNVTRIFF